MKGQTMILIDDFIDRFAAKGYTKKDAKMIIDDFFQTFAELLLLGEDRIRFVNFGTFMVKNKPARPYYKYTSRQMETVPAHKTLTFKASQGLKDLLNADKV